VTKQPIKGRGALSNPAGRFETLARGAIDDGWNSLEEEAPAPNTVVSVDPARSIITYNDSKDIGFTRSMNPYRGCGHGCPYCLAGDTDILMADGTLRKLADVRIGDRVYGTVRQGSYRRYTPARVLDHWRTIKPAYRITLEDGTQLVAGPDHRFLTDRGWKFVTGREQGRDCRPHLTVNNKLMGVGAFAQPLEMGADYKLGYLSGMIRGDGLLKDYAYTRVGRAHGNVHRFRLALADPEALRRTQEYLQEFSVQTDEFVFCTGTAGRLPMNAIRTQSRLNVESIRGLIAWPNDPTREWCAGFMAGIFDAEGSYSAGILRISNTDEGLVARMYLSLKALGFRFTIQRTERPPLKTIQVLRLLGGLREALRFFHTVNPAILRKRDISGQAVKNEARLGVRSIESIGTAMALYDITTETEDFIANGVVSHNCFARPTHAYLNLSPGLDFETRLFYKANAAAIFEQELRHPRYVCEPITVGVNTDAYQPIEREYRVTRSLLEVAQRFRQPLYLITKGATLMERDLDILGEMGRANLVAVTVSVTSLDDELKRKLEPRTSSPAARLRLIRQLADAGVPVSVNVAPVIPALTDGELEKILAAARDAGATEAGYVMLRLPWEVKDLFQEWLQAHYPDRATHVMSLMRQLHGRDPEHRPKDVVDDPEGFNQDAPPAPQPRQPDRYARNEYYNAEWGVRQRGAGPFADLFARRFAVACRRLGLNRDEREQNRRGLDTSQFRVPPAAGAQLGLDF